MSRSEDVSKSDAQGLCRECSRSKYDHHSAGRPPFRRSPLFTDIIAAAALVTSVASLVVSILNYRSSGPRVTITWHRFSIRAAEIWLEVRLANAGGGEVDLDGATCDLLGPTISTLQRLKSGSSHLLEFRTTAPTQLRSAGSVTLSVGLGTGRTLVTQLRISDEDQAAIALAAQRSLISADPANGDRAWRPPTQEEI